MLGKAVYEGVLLELPLAGFFLKKFSGKRCDLGDLASLDPEVHRHLLALRHFKGAGRWMRARARLHSPNPDQGSTPCPNPPNQSLRK
jgi:hypothetical protein